MKTYLDFFIGLCILLMCLTSALLGFDSVSSGTDFSEKNISENDRLTNVEAAAIVETEEKSKELAKDLREQELKNAEVRATATAVVGGRKVIFNMVEPIAPESGNSINSVTNVISDSERKALLEGTQQLIEKESVQFTLSGTVWDKQVSELWWDYEGVRYRVFANANFLLFPGLGEVEDADTRYSLFTLLTDQQSNGRGPIDGKWHPSAADFSPDALEYIVVDPKDDAKIKPEAFAGIEAMLRHYADHHEEMQIRYDNAEKLRKARAAYLEANPPKERDTIINFRPRKNTPDSLPVEK